MCSKAWIGCGWAPSGSFLPLGVLGAVPTALLGWQFLRRGFAVSTVAAGAAAGTLAGLSGVLLLELHCDNF
jgi:hypothetical protein